VRGSFLAGKLFTSILNIPRRMFEGMIEDLGGFVSYPPPFFLGVVGGGADILV
jgi:hypothetical protein